MPGRLATPDELAAFESDEKAPRVATPEEKAAFEAGGASAAPESRTVKSPDYLDRVVSDQQKQQPAMWGALAAGAHGAAAGMEGPINGALAGAKEDLKNIFTTGSSDPTKAKAAYVKERDSVEGAQKQNLKDFPHAPIVGAVMGGAVGQAPTLLGRLAMGLAQGATYGAGTSKADLAKGETKPFLVDTAIGGGIGLGGATAGEALNAGAGALGKRLAGVLSKNTDAAQLAAEKAFGSARGAYGGEVSSAARTLEVLEKAASDPNLPEDVSRGAADMLAGPEGQALKAQVVRSSTGRFSDQLGRLQSARDAMAEAGQGLQPDAVAGAAERRLNDSSALTRRLRELLPKVVLPMVGGALAGPAGAGAGALSGAVLGRSGTTVRNMVADPYVASRLLGFGSKVLGGAGTGVARAAPAVGEASGASDEIKPYLDLLREEK